jgi:hypothetical protein
MSAFSAWAETSPCTSIILVVADIRRTFITALAWGILLLLH